MTTPSGASPDFASGEDAAARGGAASTPLLSLRGIHKSFSGVVALRDARLEVRAGEVHGLVGENGAGKSTLINIATGVLRADAGEMRIAGEPAALHGPRDAASRGIAVVHQEADLFPQLSLAENMLLARGMVRNRLGLVDWAGTHARAREEVAALGESFDVRATASGLSVAQRMIAELAAAVSENARILFLDEPTASLTLKEIDQLFAQIRRLRDEGVGIVYVSHRLDEVLQLCDRVTIMRDGETVDAHAAAGLTMDQIVAAMVGREPSQLYSKTPAPVGEPRLKIDGYTDAAGAFHDISFDVRAGEIVGLYGFVGAGRSELGQALFGLRRTSGGTATLDGQPLPADSPRAAMRAGLAYLPEDRLTQGIFAGHALRTNASAPLLRRLSVAGIIRGRAERALAEGVISDMRVRAASMEQPIGTLSGGNQQKVVFGRWQATAPKAFILDEPTRGVDVGAKAEIHRLVCETAEKGAAVLLISSELPEVMAMSDRVVTISEGRKTGEFRPKTDSEETVAAAAVPASAEAVGETRPSRIWAAAARYREAGLAAIIGVLCAAMLALRPTEFGTADNFLDILANAAIPAIIAQGAMLIICAGGIDISVGSVMGLAAALAGLAVKAGWPPTAALALAMGSGLLFSLANASVSLAARIHPIIVTLAGLSIYRGFMHLAMGGREIQNFPGAYRALADGELMGIPKLVWYVLAVTLVAHVVLRYTIVGRRVLALGNSQAAAQRIGLSRWRLTLFVFAFSGALVGLAAVLNTAYYGKVQANTGAMMELRAIAAAVIGGANILGGRGAAIGTLLGAFLVALLYNALILLGISSFWQDLFVGALILGAVVADVGLQRVRERAL